MNWNGTSHCQSNYNQTWSHSNHNHFIFKTFQNLVNGSDLFSLLHQSLRRNELQAASKSLLAAPVPPAFLSRNAWLNLHALERRSHAFRNLTDSFKDNASKWVEYFHMDCGAASSTDLTEKDIDLLNDTPLEAELDLTQKLILWLTIHPERTADIIQKYNVYNYGGLLGNYVELDLEMAYKISAPSVPLLVTVPKSGKCILWAGTCRGCWGATQLQSTLIGRLLLVES